MIDPPPLSTGRSRHSKVEIKNTRLAVFTLGASRKCCNKISHSPKHKACPPEIRGSKGIFQGLLPRPQQASDSSLLLCWKCLVWSTAHFCLPFLPEKEEINPSPMGHDMLTSPGTFHLELPRKILSSSRGHVETSLTLLKNEIEEPHSLPNSSKTRCHHIHAHVLFSHTAVF